MADDGQPSRLLGLPGELLEGVIRYLMPTDLSRLLRASRGLRQFIIESPQWRQFFLISTHGADLRPLDLQSHRAVYDFYTGSMGHFWFLTERKLWFGDMEFEGKLAIARFNPHDPAIEVLPLTATRPNNPLVNWTRDANVVYHPFAPAVSVEADAIVVRITPESLAQAQGKSYPAEEVPMGIYGGSYLLQSSFMFTFATESAARDPWPPRSLPAVQRTPRSLVQRPHENDERAPSSIRKSRGTFCVRMRPTGAGNRFLPRLLQFDEANIGNAMNRFLGRDVLYGTLPEECYTPTPQKPWRGIWVGDYEGHGTEFLVFLQPDEPSPLPRKAGKALRLINRVRRDAQDHEYDVSDPASPNSDTDDSDDDDDPAMLERLGPAIAREFAPEHNAAYPGAGQHGEYSGRLEAVKLTGDENVPRGQPSFIIPDLGEAGYVRTADEPEFAGARIVLSLGHVAARGFKNDSYTPAQAFLLDHDTIVQYWLDFGHMSFFRRLPIDSFLTYGFDRLRLGRSKQLSSG